jgi:ParB-like chromosome segregation protein Spo0J
MKLKDILESIYNREDMPQIQGSDLKDAFSILKKAGIPVSIDTALPKKLRHSQKTANKKKILSITRSIGRGEKIPPIVISEDNYIVDGHHRQLAYAVVEPDEEIPVIKIGLPRDEAIKAYKAVEKYMEK